MIALLSGILKYKESPVAIIDCGGVGYEVELTASAFVNLPNIGDHSTIYTHFTVREDAQILFGFKDFAERDLFRILIKVNGVGPKVAIAILSGMSSSDLIKAITQEDAKQLIKLPGVGKKMAERLIVELKDKFDHLLVAGEVSSNLSNKTQSSVQSDAIAALMSMGYRASEAEKMTAGVYTETSTVEDVIKQALKTKIKK